MPRINTSRKARFKAALALAGMQRQEWAAKAGVTPQHLGAVIRDARPSGVLIERIDAFIAQVEAKARAAA